MMALEDKEFRPGNSRHTVEGTNVLCCFLMAHCNHVYPSEKSGASFCNKASSYATRRKPN